MKDSKRGNRNQWIGVVHYTAILRGTVAKK